MVTFVELPLFTQQITGLVDDAVYGLFQKDLLRRVRTSVRNNLGGCGMPLPSLNGNFEHETKGN